MLEAHVLPGACFELKVDRAAPGALEGLSALADPPSLALPGRAPDSKEPWGFFLGRAAHVAMGLQYRVQHPTHVVFVDTADLSTIVEKGGLGNPRLLSKFVRCLRPDITGTPDAHWKELAAQKEEPLPGEEIEKHGAMVEQAVQGAYGTGEWPVWVRMPGLPARGLSMSESLSSGLEFPAMLHGLTRTVRPKVRAQGQRWAREYLKTGAFTQPRSMLRIAPGELLEMQSAVLFDFVPRDRWRVHMFDSVFLPFDAGLPEGECQLARERLESFCLSTHRKTLEAWCPSGAVSVREHMSLAVERMSRATREDCTQALLRMIPLLMAEDSGFKHRAVLSDFDFLRERLTALPSGDFDSISGACKDPVTLQLADWNRALSRP